MKKSFIAALTFAIIILNYLHLFSISTIPDETDTERYTSWLEKQITENPAADNTGILLVKLLKLTPAVGNTRIAAQLNSALKHLETKISYRGINPQLLRLAIDDLEGSNKTCSEHFTVVRRWNISGPWKKYGKPDLAYTFQPEKAVSLRDIEKSRHIACGIDGEVFPFRHERDKDETVYATTSFSGDRGIVLWIISDAEYRLTVNGQNVYRKTGADIKTTEAFRLKGGRGYTIQLKIQGGDNFRNPFFKAMLSSENNLPVEAKSSINIFSYTFTSERITEYNDNKPSTNRSSDQIAAIRNLILSHEYLSAYKLGISALQESPTYYPLYEIFIPLLDIMNRENEFHEVIENFHKIFPGSMMHNYWFADFYMTRDINKFTELMESIPPCYLSEKAIESYIYTLCGNKKFTEALSYCRLLKKSQHITQIIPELIRASGDEKLWRKTLFEQISRTGELSGYYYLGLSELNGGLDPVLYWNKAFSSGYNPGMMRELCKIYENGITSNNEYYSGDYTDFHPDFKRSAKIRKVTIHIFSPEKIVIEGEDLIPQGSVLKNQKFFDSGIEYLSGEIKTSVPYFNGMKILYVLSAKDGLPDINKYSSSLSGNDRLLVKYKTTGEEFSVIKYSGEYTGTTEDLFSIINELKLKDSSEDISSIEYKVICHSNFIPYVKYNGSVVKPSNHTEENTFFYSETKFNSDSKESLSSSILKFSSDKDFVEWYKGILASINKPSLTGSTGIFENKNLETIIREVHALVITKISETGKVTFNPERLEMILSSGRGTVEERIYLARALLEQKGIKSFIAFRKNKPGLPDKIFLYVPEYIKRGYWLDFYGFDKIDDEQIYNAIVITGESYVTIPIDRKSCIR